jgi:enamine deaminase RidA (YjgF/YER057c/UK114 family)
MGSPPDFERFTTGAVWESRYGYCRAVKIPLCDDPGSRSLIAVTGTAPIADDGTVFAPGDAYAQAMRCYGIIGRALEALGAGPASVFRSRMFVTDISRSDEFGRAHRGFFAGHTTALTMVGGVVLIDPAMLVEIEVDALA